jgi:acid phosphatase type 7
MDELARLTYRSVCSLGVVIAVVALVACGSNRSPASPSRPPDVTEVGALPSPGPTGGGVAVLVGAGDIARCGEDLVNAEATARLLDGIDGTIFTAGDNTQTAGTAEEFRDCYATTWGRHRARTRPSPGNHDYGTAGAAPYFDYFGANAGPSGRGYYSYDLGAWHIVSLNSNVSMTAGSAQVAWLRQDLEASRSPCTLAYWHHPLVSSSTNGNNTSVREAWKVLYEHGAEVVLNGHDHLFQRFAPQDPDLRLDLLRGIREFVVGTGGCYLYRVENLQPNSEVTASVHGVLKLTLRPDGYDWQFVSVPGDHFTDAGSGACHS